jgi:hypothetical protein
MLAVPWKSGASAPRQASTNSTRHSTVKIGLLPAEFRSRRLSCAVTKVKDLDHALLVIYPVVNQERAMEQFPNLRPRTDDATHTRKTDEQVNVVQQGTAEAGGCIRVIFGDVADDFGKIVQRPLRVEEAVIHLGNRLRSSSAGTVRSALASRMPSSMAASVSSSSSSRMGAGLSSSNFFALAIALS